MNFARKAEDLIAKLPLVRGRYKSFAPIGETSWFRTGGVAEVLYKPADREDLIDFLKACPEDIPYHSFGSVFEYHYS